MDLSANRDIRAIKNKQFLTELFNTMYSELTVSKFNKKNKCRDMMILIIGSIILFIHAVIVFNTGGDKKII